MDSRNDSQHIAASDETAPGRSLDAGPGGDIASLDHVNYFNYFTEVEDEFVRRRGKHLLVSPMDWALVESWKDAGIPLTVVIRGISRAFEAFASRPRQFSRINSILYCEQAVEETYAEYQLARVGAHSAASTDGVEGGEKQPRQPRNQSSSFTRESILDFIRRCQEQLAGAARWLAERKPSADDLGPAIDASQALSGLDRAAFRLTEIAVALAATVSIDAEAVEIDLCALDNMLFEHLKLGYGPEVMQSLRKEAEAQLKTYRSNMDQTMYERTLDNFIGKRLRAMCRVPRLSLFYM